MQLDLLAQMREQLVAENRQRFQKVAKEPSSFSQLQIQAYLKTVAFRREVNEVQRAASGRGIGGVPSARIASESDREFIFSSTSNGKNVSMNSDGKEGIADGTAAGKENIKETSAFLPSVVSASAASSFFKKSHAVEEIEGDEAEERPEMSKASVANTVQTYVDEKGQLRVSKVRGMGVRMTRDLQWNLYLLKDKEAQTLENPSKPLETENKGENLASLQISFEDDGEPDLDQETKDLFSGIISDQYRFNAGQESATKSSVNSELISRAGFESTSEDKTHKLYLDSATSLIGEGREYKECRTDLSAGTEGAEFSPTFRTENHSNEEEEDFQWEQGEINWNCQPDAGQNHEMRDNSNEKLIADQNALQDSHINLAAVREDAQCGESELEWEDGNYDTFGAVCSTSNVKDIELITSNSEEAQLEEAIRRSLEDYSSQTPSTRVLKQLSIQEEKAQSYKATILRPSNDLDLRDQAIQDPYLTQERLRKGKALAYEEHDAKIQDLVEEQQICTKRHMQNVSATGEFFQTSLRHATGENNCTDVEVASIEIAPDIVTPDLNNHEAKIMGVQVKQRPAPSVGVQQKEIYFQIEGKVNGIEQKTEYATAIVDPQPREENCTGSQTLQGHIFHAEAKVVSMDLETEDRVQEVLSGSVLDNNFQKEDIPAEHLLRRAEETDVQRERQEMAQWEEDVLLERKELVKEKAELQAELQAKDEMNQAQLESENQMLIQEELELRAAQKKNERNADSVTGEMFAECQELLQMFGLPYVIAPMEAEAQCAFMDSIQLVDGVVTDDSDVFLFGGRNVYKNIFDDRKYVETYYMKDVEAELGINREKLIHMALLLGSDYTEGVSGIGIVNAIEVVNAFAGEDGLRLFKEWLDAPDPSLLGKFQPNAGKRGRSKKQNADLSDLKGAREGSPADLRKHDDLDRQIGDMDDIQRRRQIFMEKHRTISKNWNIPDSFPNRVVISAYNSPQVDKSSETFTWGRPDLEALRKFCLEKFLWNKDKADELLLPVLKEYDRRETQLRLEAFYSFNQRFAKIRSRRIQKAVTGITGRRSTELMDLPPDAISSPTVKKQRKRKSRQLIGKDGFSGSSTLQTQMIPESSEKDDPGHDSANIVKSPSKSVNASGKEIGMNTKGNISSLCGSRARGIQKTAKKSKKERKAPLKETSSSDSDNAIWDNLADYGGVDPQGKQQQCRRSMRVQSNAKYTCDDSENGSGDDDKDGDFSVTHHLSPGITSRTALSASEPFNSQRIDKCQGTAEVMKEQLLGKAHENEMMEMENGDEDYKYLQVGGGFVPTEQEQDNEFHEQDFDLPLKQTNPQAHNVTSRLQASSQDDPETSAASFAVKDPPLNTGARLRAAPFLRRKKK
ncbi:hypothetical protein O6H91_06G054200 [Diphasiastrum complanatum]|nr:hypothetical protein O6H91_06G054200 [Diphasiastrum complanatum]